jgi:hypothetical protein
VRELMAAEIEAMAANHAAEREWEAKAKEFAGVAERLRAEEIAAGRCPSCFRKFSDLDEVATMLDEARAGTAEAERLLLEARKLLGPEPEPGER